MAEKIKFSVTRNGKPLDPRLYTWDEETRTFSTTENGLVLYFTGVCYCTFDTGAYCVIIRRDEYEKLYAECEELKEELKPFEDEYFKDLDPTIIAELAKKSIRLSRENLKLEDALDEIKDICCAKNKNCHIGCFICSTKCNEDKILAIINKAKEVENQG